MNLKKDEFCTLRQGGRMLKEYMDDFCSLSRYAPEDIDTDAKRKDKFLSGLKGKLKISLSVPYAPSYQALLDQAVTLDNNIRKEEKHKRKFNGGKNHTSESGGNGNSHRHKGHIRKGNGGNFNGHRHNGGFKGNNSNGHNNNGHHNGGDGHRRFNSDAKKDLSNATCFKCKKTGHYSTSCPENKTDDAAKPNPFQKGQVNHLNVEEVMNEPDAVMGTFLMAHG
jgi:hypothetical protein